MAPPPTHQAHPASQHQHQHHNLHTRATPAPGTSTRTPAPAPPPAHKGPPSTHPWPDVQPAQHGQPALLGRAGRHPLYLALGLGLQCLSPIVLNARSSESAILSLRYLDLWSVYQTPRTCTKVFHRGKQLPHQSGHLSFIRKRLNRYRCKQGSKG